MNINVYYKIKQQITKQNTQNTECICLVCERIARNAFLWTRACGSVTAVMYAPCKKPKTVYNKCACFPYPYPLSEKVGITYTNVLRADLPATIFWKIMTSIMCLQAIVISNWLMLKSTRLATMGHYIYTKSIILVCTRNLF